MMMFLVPDIDAHFQVGTFSYIQVLRKGINKRMLLIISNWWALPQNILEKFEFFPIKCRVQRSLDVFKMAQGYRKDDDDSFRAKSFRVKV